MNGLDRYRMKDIENLTKNPLFRLPKWQLDLILNMPDLSALPDMSKIPNEILKQNIPYVCEDCGEFVCVCEIDEETASGD